MEVVWRADAPTTVREVYEVLTRSRTLAYTTVMTVMDNLHGKGVLTRQREGRAYRYRPTRSREEYNAMLMAEVLESSVDQTATLVRFVQRMDPDEVAELRRALDEAERRGEGEAAPPDPSA